MSSRVKSKTQKIPRPCTNCFKPRYLKFNLSYLRECKIDKNYKAQLFDRMLFLSKRSVVSLMTMDKSLAFEFLDKNKLGYKKDYPTEMKERFGDELSLQKIAIARLYPNNNPIVGRIIGVIMNKIFYILEIDIGGKSYKH